ncbi:hypothetical protein JOF56_010034 [Kibdelosporangium banguiense]|uniref:Uncharacterized protein n=1 Tax=Kibdelosporangium banguiense TaxID=1365924 RepID=A0ABS4U0A0_9PSEU|nr:hypothetical protein [Kibdelosporangium banguiense]MBP2329649.1 hypothetical protein [Kibdelosporangium banguiense]
MTTTSPDTAAGRQAALDAARLVLAGMGLSAQDLLTEPDTRSPAALWSRVRQRWSRSVSRRISSPSGIPARARVSSRSATRSASGSVAASRSPALRRREASSACGLAQYFFPPCLPFGNQFGHSGRAHGCSPASRRSSSVHRGSAGPSCGPDPPGPAGSGVSAARGPSS